MILLSCANIVVLASRRSIFQGWIGSIFVIGKNFKGATKVFKNKIDRFARITHSIKQVFLNILNMKINIIQIPQNILYKYYG
jgi:hypothetical protein